MLKKLLAALGALALVAGLVALVAGPASAHNHSVTPDCTSGVSVDLTNYATGTPNANHLTVTLDGTTVYDKAFSGSVVTTFAWPVVPKATHTYTVTVYAYDDKPPAGSLNGPNGYSFTTGDQSIGNCETGVTPAAATRSPAVCTGAGIVGGGGYNIPAISTGVSRFEAQVDNGAWLPASLGFHPLDVGQTVNIRADLVDGYKFTGPSTWTFTIVGDDASTCIVASPPTATYSECVKATPGTSTPAYYTIPDTKNLPYHYEFATGGTPHLGKTTVTTFETVIHLVLVVTAPYKVPANAQIKWDFDFTSPGNCYGQSNPTGPTAKYTTCSTTLAGQSSDNTYTVPGDTGVTYQIKNANGGWDDVTAKTYTFGSGKTAGVVEIQAIAAGPYTIAPGATTYWKFTYGDAKDCLFPVVPNASSKPVVCDTHNGGQQVAGTYTLDAVTGVLYQVKLDDGDYKGQLPGTYDVTFGHTIVVLATAAKGYQNTGPSTWTFKFTSAGACILKVPAGDPQFVNPSCDVAKPGQIIAGSYLVVLAAHVHYEAQVNGAASVALTEGKLYPAQPGDVVNITLVADPGYIVSPVIAAEKLDHAFTSVANNCLVKTPFIKPAPTDQSCVVTDLDTPGTLKDSFITIPSLVDSPHAIYSINDVVAAPGQHILPPGTYKVSVAAEFGYYFDGPAGPWDEKLASAQPCGQLITHPLVEPSALPVPMGCFTNGSYTLSNDLADSNALIWTVNGSVVGEGKYVVSTPRTVTVHVATSGPSYGFEQDAKTDYTFSFVRPTTCDLKTLALTGSTPVGWIALGYAMLVSGLALLAVRFTRRRGEQA